MTYIIWIVVAFVVLLLAWFVYGLLRGKPWTVDLLYARTFIRFAITGPELLTMLGVLEKFGIHAHNAKLSDASIEHDTKMFAWIKRDLAILRSYSRARQSPSQLLSTDIMDYFLDDITRTETYRFHDYPLNQMFGIQSELPNFMMTIHPVTGRVEAFNYVKRLNRFGVKFDQVLAGLKVREQKGVIPPKFVIRRVLDEMTAFVDQPAHDNPLYTVFHDKLVKLDNVDEASRSNALAAAEAAIRSTVYPAYKRLIEYFTDLEKKASDDDGVWKLPDGAAYYAHCLRSNTTTDLNPDEVHATGLKEVERIEAEMRAILEKQGYKGVKSPARKLLEFGEQERFLFPNTDEGRAAALAEYQRILDEIDGRLGEVFDIRARAKLKVERVPEFREKTSAGAYYMMGDLAGGRPGVFYANLRDMKEVHKFGMKTLSYHEGVPGHHFQLSIQQELKGLPFFRRLVPFTAYAEGWALYAEKLAREIGCYRDDPFGELACLDAELFRAVRLVVDTGIHTKRWTRQQAIDYMEAHSGQVHESVVSEVERYIVMPGQACAYKIGELKILALRDRAKKALGDKFDLRQFHNVILKNGSMPLTVLERVVDAYIQENK